MATRKKTTRRRTPRKQRTEGVANGRHARTPDVWSQIEQAADRLEKAADLVGQAYAIPLDFGRACRDLGWSKSRLCKKSEIDARTLYHWEFEGGKPRPEELRRVLRTLKTHRSS